MHHLPPGTSKWNKIEHRLFSFITMNWKATPLVSYRVIVDLIGATQTKTGLAVRCELDSTEYPKGIVVSDQEMDILHISHDEFHGEWNYTIHPVPGPQRPLRQPKQLILPASAPCKSGRARGWARPEGVHQIRVALRRLRTAFALLRSELASPALELSAPKRNQKAVACDDTASGAFERSETELMLSSFPSSFCTDGGRAIIDAGAPPINKPSREETAARADEPEWLATLPAGHARCMISGRAI